MRLSFIRLLVISLVLWLSACGVNSPSGVVRAFYTNIDKGEITQAMGSLSESVMFIGEPKIRKSLEAQTEKFGQMGGLQRIDTEDDCKGEVCHVNTKLTFKNGKEISERVKMQKEKGQWKIGAGGAF